MSCGERLRQALREQGFRVTPQRGVILESIAHAEGHISAQQVFNDARGRLPGLNLATVYRTLETLHRAGFLDQLASTDEVVRFALRDRQDPHGHLACRGCGEVLEFDLRLLDGLQQALRRRHGFAIDAAHLTLGGLCGRCRASDTRRQ